MRFRKRSNIGLTMILIFVMCSTGCNESSKYKAFTRAHDAIRLGMSISDALYIGLADYLVIMGNKNVPGGTLQERVPASTACSRHFLDICYSNSNAFFVRVYCNTNEPGASEVMPPKSFKNKQQLVRALQSVYAAWANSMSFRVESPPKSLFGVYDHFEIRTDAEGNVASVSPIYVSK